MNSFCFHTLVSNVSKIKNHFAEKTDGGRVFDSISSSAFILLVHAELESYFETIARSAVDSAFDDIDQQLHGGDTCFLSTNSLLVSISGYFSAGISPGVTSPSTRLSQVRSKYSEQLDTNHGIKTDNLSRIFSPLGYSIKPKFNTLLVSLDTFGEKRGLFAHNSSIVSAQAELASEFADVDSLVTALSAFDSDFYSKVIAT